MSSGIILGVTLALAVTLLSAAEVSDDLAEVFDNAERKCLEKHRIPQEERMSLFRMMESSDDNIKCFLSCFFEEVGMMNGLEFNSTLFDELLVEEMKTNTMSEEELTDVRNCIDGVSASDKCQKAFEYYMCLGHKFNNK